MDSGSGTTKAKALGGKKRLGRRRRRLQAGAHEEGGKTQVETVEVVLGDELERDGEVRVEKAVVITDDQPGAGKKKRKREQRRQAMIANKLWRNFDRGSEQANKFFEAYYRQQLHIADDKEWAAFAKSLSENLLVTFRLNRGRFPLIARSLEHRLHDEFRFSGSFVRVGVDKVLASGEVVRPVPWLRDAHQLGTDRAGFSKAKALGPLYDTIEREARLGHIARQGLASMVPALVLDPRPEHRVLDMCAAPGSKSEQLLQMMGVDAPGVVVTNDSDPKRLQSLKRRFAKLAHTNLLVTCSRGEDLYRHMGSEQFDGIICDVPCSGDGTIRKYPYLWRRWRAKRGVMLHPLQLQLAQSAASLLKVGGRLVYSTCSINPIEDEAVVAALLESAKGALRLVPIRLGSFKTRPGLCEWSCEEELMLAGAGDESDDEAEVEAAAAAAAAENGTEPGAGAPQRKKNRKGKKRAPPVHVTATMTAPSPKAAASYNLDRCVRILHHDNDTEGFFVALLEKVAAWEMGQPGGGKSSGGSKALSAKSAKDVLRGVGFNPRLAGDAANLDAGQVEFLSQSAASLALQELASIVGEGASLVEGTDFRFKRSGPEELSVTVVSPAVAEMLDAPWATSGAVPVVLAGADVASASCRFAAGPKGSASVLTSVQSMAPLASGALAAATWLAGVQAPAVVEVDCTGMFLLLQLAMQTLRESEEPGSDAEAEDADQPTAAARAKRQSGPRALHVDLKTCVSLLEQPGDEDEDAEVDPEMCEREISRRLLQMERHASVFVVLPSEAVSLSTEAAAAAAPVPAQVEARAAKPEPGKRMSAAERRRLKKQRASKDGAGSIGDAKKLVLEATEPAVPEAAPVDMFAHTPEPQFHMAIVLRKVAPNTLEFIVDPEQVASYGQALQTLQAELGISSLDADSDDEVSLDESDEDN